MKKNECKEYIEMLARFLIKNKNRYSQDMSNKLKEKFNVFNISCGNDELDICISIHRRK